MKVTFWFHMTVYSCYLMLRKWINIQGEHCQDFNQCIEKFLKWFIMTGKASAFPEHTDPQLSRGGVLANSEFLVCVIDSTFLAILERCFN